MTSRFRNQLTIVPPVRVALSRNGVATTIDWSSRGADKGLLGSSRSMRTIGDVRRSGPLATDPYLIPGTRKDFGGGEVATLTSKGLNGFKELIIATRERRREIQADLKTAKWQLAFSWTAKALAGVTLLSAVSPSVRNKTDTALALRRSEVGNLNSNLSTSHIAISFDMDTPVAGPHAKMLLAFDKLRNSQRSWILQTTQRIDRVRARSMADTVVSRGNAVLGRNADQLISTNDQPLAISVQNGRATAYFYPGFLLVTSSSTDDFAVIDLRELDVFYDASSFTETESIPSDATMVGKVWAKSNKNGTRDRRFKDNRELPVMRYGHVGLWSQEGMDELLMFSRDDACREFVSAVKELQNMLKSGPQNRFDPARPAITQR